MLPVRVNSRKFISLHFFNDIQDATDNEARFVCSIPTMGVLELLSVSQTVRATSDECTDKDTMVSLYQIEQPVEGTDDFTFHFYPVERAKELKLDPVDKVPALLNLSKGNGHCMLSFNYKQAYRCVSLRCVLHMNSDKDWESFLTFDLIPEKDMYRVALDFGSEASQGLLLPMGMGAKESTLPFIDLAKCYLYPQYKDQKNNAFHQFEHWEAHSDLFRSVFYVKDRHPLFLSLQNDDNMLLKEGSQLPNIKIALLDNNSGNVIRYYANIVLQFIRAACWQIMDYRTREGGSHPIGLRLDLLVPNVMDMGLTRKLIADIQSKFSSMMDDSVMGLFLLEINPFSESDASFLGYFQNHRGSKDRLVEGRSYLMIDGGKGTMDYSVISILDTVSYYSKYRDGFVGSGNAVTYAVFDHLCAVIVGFLDNANRRKLMTSLLFSAQTDQLGLRKLLTVLEAIKAAEPNPVTAERNCKALHDRFAAKWQQVNLETLTQFLHEHPGDYGDAYGIIHATCDKICRLLVDNLVRNRIVSDSMPDDRRTGDVPACTFREVILAGRAFRHTILRRTLNSYMERFFGIQPDEIRFDNSTAKISCLYGLFHFKMVNCNCGLSGIPSIGVVLNKVGFEPSTKKKKETAAQVDSMWRYLFGSAIIQSQDSEPIKTFRVDESFLCNGCEIKLRSNEVLYLNGHELQTVNPVSTDSDQSEKDVDKYNLYFDGTELLLRSRHNVSPLRRAPAKIPVVSSLIYESRFPNYERATDNSRDRDNLRLFLFPELVKSQIES